ncbi:MAG: 4-(cytidine 5'-diphospho)-2-C-methyl-D-erythritol kinase [Peptostreptococcaceae bacterium]|nr:4-(cytidine 5'-diphospho)-2-C-methyl-D-erythritol kinase [Peptostreptococcaceae bacterium]
MKKIRLKANAKVNLSLDVKGRREDGYHELWMIMQSIGLSDIVTIEENCEEKVNLFGSNLPLPKAEENIAVYAANRLRDEYKIKEGVNIHIEKNIPLGSGMGGGSADAAAVLLGLDLLWNLGAGEESLMRTGRLLGADVPFAIHGGTAIAEGIGEKITPLPFFSADLLVIKPKPSILTKTVFQRLDLRKPLKKPDQHLLLDCIFKGEIRGLALNMKNVLEEVTEKEICEVANIKKRLLDCGAAGSMMSGSGTAVFGIFEDRKSLEKARLVLNREYPQVYSVSTARKGVEIV